MIDTLVNLVIYILVLGLIFWLLDYLIANIPMQDPFRRVARMVLLVVGILILIILLLGLVGGSPGVPRLRLGNLASSVVAACHPTVSLVLAKMIALSGFQFAPAYRKVVIEAVSLSRAEVVLADGSILPIVNWFDCDGDECDRGDAVVAVAGCDRFGWTAIDLDDFVFDTVLH